MKLKQCFLLFVSGFLAPSVSAEVQSGLMAYYDFEQTGSAGLANKAPGATSYDATRTGTNPSYTDWATGDNPTGPGFAGKADFTGVGASGVSDRSVVKIGNALNLDDGRDEAVSIPIGTAQMGQNFTISAWHKLSPGAANTSNRYHLLESSNNFDVSWGTSNTAFTTPQASYSYLAYIGEAPTGGFGPTGVSTGDWHHLLYSVSTDGTTSTLRLYFDGNLVGSQTVATSLIDFSQLLIGRHRTSITGDRDWDGMVDEVAIWNRALKGNEAREVFLRGSNGIALTTDLTTVNRAFISVTASNPAGGAVFGTGLYQIGDVVQVESIANPGYLDATWASPDDSQPSSFEHIIAVSRDFVATFPQDLSDADQDGLSNFAEITIYTTDPMLADTDGDLILDGQEVNLTHTSPKVSQAAAVQWVLANLSGGGVSPGDVVLQRNTESNSLTFQLGIKESTTLSANGWSTVGSSALGVSSSTTETTLRIQLPGNAAERRFFQVNGATSPP